MPLGDPCGKDFVYTTEGLPENITLVTIPVRDVEKSIRFYRDLLYMDLISMKDGYAIMRRKGAIIMLKKSSQVGVDTGIYLGVENPYDLHRRLVDEGVLFIREPMKGPVGLYTSFRDDDGNTIHAIDYVTDL